MSARTDTVSPLPLFSYAVLDFFLCPVCLVTGLKQVSSDHIPIPLFCLVTRFLGNGALRALERCHASSLKIKTYKRPDNHFLLRVPVPLLWLEMEPMATSSDEDSADVKEQKSQF